MIQTLGLDIGETHAISLAQELHADAVLIDERPALTIARKAGLVVTGTLGVLEIAAERGSNSMSVWSSTTA